MAATVLRAGLCRFDGLFSADEEAALVDFCDEALERGYSELFEMLLEFADGSSPENLNSPRSQFDAERLSWLRARSHGEACLPA